MELLQKLIAGKDLSAEEAESAMDAMMNAKYTAAQTAALLVALRLKGETEDEIAAFAKVMRKNAVQIHPTFGYAEGAAVGNFSGNSRTSDRMAKTGSGKPETPNSKLVDTCGTGGDSSHTFNISTAAAFIAAGAGVKIAKHGNRSISSASGSADVLEQLGAKMLQPQQVEKCIEKVGIGFMFAPFFHPAMKNVGPVRKELGIRTIFNLLGPLTNPANAKAQVLGVFSPSLTERFAKVLHSLGTENALVVHSEGMDEIGLGKTNISELKDGEIKSYELDAKEFGFAKKEIPKCDSKEESAKIILGVLNGEKGAARDISVINAAAAIYAGRNAQTLKDGIGIANESIDSGKAREKLNALVKFTGE